MLTIGKPGITGTGILSVSGGVSVAGGGGVQPQPFVGPYDGIDNIAALYAMRLGLSPYYGSPLIRVRRSSDNAEDDIGHLSNGDLDTAAVADFIGAGSGYIVTWYDQSGNGNDATQSTAAAQPLYVASGQNSRPVVRFDGTDDYLTRADALGFTGNPDITVMVAAVRTGGPVATALVGLGSSSGTGGQVIGCGLENAVPVYWFNDGNRKFGNASLVTFGLALWRRTAGSTYADSEFYLNGAQETATSTSNGTNTLSLVDETFNIGRLPGSANRFGGDMAEIVVASAAWSTAQRQAAEQAANDYWQVY